MSSTDARLVFATPDGTGIEVFLPDDARAVIETALRRERTRTHERLVVRSRDLLLPSGRRTRRTDELIGEICDEIEAVVASTPTTIDPTTADRLAAALEGLATVRAAYQEPDADLLRSFAAQVELATHGLFRPTRTATWLLCWPAELVEVLDAELARLTRAMESDDATVARLFPAPHLDPELAEGWDALMRRSLVERRLEAIVEVRAAVEDGHTDEDGVAALLRTVNDLRLMIGTELGISEDDDTARRRGGADRERVDIYEVFGFVLSRLLDALDIG